MDVEARLTALEHKVALLEDRAALFQLLASYGPAVDSLSVVGLCALWEPGGAYYSDALVFNGKDGLADLINGAFHQQVVKTGSAHIVSLPHLEIAGDRAVATNYSMLAVAQADQHQILRASANRWEFVRTAAGWQVDLRTNRRLDGDPQARALLARIFPQT